MENLFIAPTELTPQVDFELTTGVLEISGVSRPEDVLVFFDTPLDWIQNLNLALSENSLLVKDLPPLKLIFNMSYYNTSSSKYLIQILKSLCKVKDYGVSLSIEWHYEEGDEKMKEDGEDLAEAVDMKFKYFEEK
jgi:hypothetical protein